MNDLGKIIFGLIVFLALATIPVWYGISKGDIENANPVLPDKDKYTECVESAEYMRVNHMNILDEWRNKVVRDGDLTPVVIDGVEYETSLTKTCLKCHANKAQFCDKCHTYADVDPYCWDCHVEEPKGE